MLSLALGLAETIGATDLFVGVNAVDYSGYPDCRPEFIEQFERLAIVATKAGAEGTKFKVHAPLIIWMPPCSLLSGCHAVPEASRAIG